MPSFIKESRINTIRFNGKIICMVPDFPGGGLIVGRSGIKNIFETGQGVVKS